MKGNKRYAYLLVTLLVVTLTTYIIFSDYFQQSRSLSQAKIDELRLKYPVYPGYPFYMEVKEPRFDEVLKMSDSIVLAEIVEELPEYTVELIHNSSTPEGQIYEKGKEYGLTNTTTFVQYKVKILEYIAGNSTETVNNEDQDIIISYSSELKNYMPKLKPGMRIITPIKRGRGQHEGKYLFIKYGLYYVTDDQYVLSAYVEDNSALFTGKTVNYLKEAIKKMYNKN